MRRARKKTTDFSPRRRWPRQKVDVPVRLVLRGYNRTFLVEGCGNDLSEGGMLVFAGLQLPVGREVEVEIQLPESREPLRLPATIRDRDRGTLTAPSQLTPLSSRAHQIGSLANRPAKSKDLEFRTYHTNSPGELYPFPAAQQ
jgi:hypothetical protein